MSLGDREQQKPQWCNPKKEDRSFGDSCYCQQLQFPSCLHRNTHSKLLHDLFHNFCTVLRHNNKSSPCKSQPSSEVSGFERKSQQSFLMSVHKAKHECVLSQHLPASATIKQEMCSHHYSLDSLKSLNINKHLSGSMFV